MLQDTLDRKSKGVVLCYPRINRLL